jgi:hypothetical protein
MAETVQVNAIGVIKQTVSLQSGLYACAGRAERPAKTLLANDCYNLTLSSDVQDAELTRLCQILALIKRSDSTAIKSEGMRVFANVIRAPGHPGRRRRGALSGDARAQNRAAAASR